MLSELTFFQPFDDASGKSSVLVVAFGDEGLGCCDEKSGDQQGRENDSRTALSCLGGEQQHGLAIKTNPYPGRQRANSDSCKCLSQRPSSRHHNGENSSPCKASQAQAETDGLARDFKTPEAAAGKLCVDGSRNDASIHQHERLRTGTR